MQTTTDSLAVERELLTPDEAAAYSRLSVATIRNWLRSNHLPHFRVVNRIRIVRGDLDAVLRAGGPKKAPAARKAVAL